MLANFDIYVYIIERGNLFHPYKLGRAPYDVFLNYFYKVYRELSERKKEDVLPVVLFTF